MFPLVGTASKSPFSFFPGEGGEARRTITSWLDQSKSGSPLDLTPDVAIETGVFKVRDLGNMQLHTGCSTCAWCKTKLCSSSLHTQGPSGVLDVVRNAFALRLDLGEA